MHVAIVGFTLLSLAGLSDASQEQLAARVFEPYEAVRAALSADKLDGIAEHSKNLAPLAGEFAGPEAQLAADRLGKASDLKAARDAFGALSKLLVPKLVEAKLAGVYAFACSMVKLPWAQRGEKVQNPYMGKAMPTCGTPYRAKG